VKKIEINPKKLIIQGAAVMVMFGISMGWYYYNRSQQKMIDEMPLFETTIVRSSIDHGWLTLNDTIIVYGLSTSINAHGKEVRLMDLALPFVLKKESDKHFLVIHDWDTLRFNTDIE
jgi:hypothetical protein